MYVIIKTLVFLSLLRPLLAQDSTGPQNDRPLPVEISDFKVCENCQSYFKNQEQFAFGESPQFHNDPVKWSTHSILIMQGGEIVSERYAKHFSIDKPHRLWSMTKSISSLLIGLRAHEGHLSLNDPLSKFFTEVQNRPEKRTLTLKHLLTMTSGIDWQEIYEDNPFKSDVIKMLYLKENKDMANFVLSHPQRYRPGKYFYYSSGETNLLMGALKKSFSSLQTYQNYPWKALFEPLNIKTAQWETDHSGTFVGSSYLYMSPRDLSKIAKLILNRGLNDDQKQIISPEYIRESFLPSAASCTTQLRESEPAFSYGYSWWLNAPCPERSRRKKAYENLPDDLILALGHHGQTMGIFPSLNAVAIRFGADKVQNFNREKWLENVYENLRTFIQQQRSDIQ